MIRILPIKDCKECPHWNEEPIYHECRLTDTRCYEKDGNWTDYLEQYCPLEYLDSIIDEAYNKGKEYMVMKEQAETQVRLSTEPTRWFTAHEFLDRLENIKGK